MHKTHIKDGVDRTIKKDVKKVLHTNIWISSNDSKLIKEYTIVHNVLTELIIEDIENIIKPDIAMSKQIELL